MNLDDVVSFTFEAYGHPAILSSHATTIELTKDDTVTSRGNCIIGVRASCALDEFPYELKQLLQSDRGRGQLRLTVGNESALIEGQGSKGLTLLSPRDIVIRRSGFISDRTLMVHADTAARDLPKRLVERLRDSRQRIIVTMSAWQV